ncbi:hypothetical protein AOXY_G20926 [Acipenser oxyrinchus oxyrinchus]|uniref:Secreted protein n=1 Tax=Acipenser oxyrinchus oxyrinchus TaxID=40147 RepID=A0AAD8D1E7_ACIOX|nr:hypothetical protein AOXY_G20926 [Acipenser oxyrinchus oxyrinchus]
MWFFSFFCFRFYFSYALRRVSLSHTALPAGRGACLLGITAGRHNQTCRLVFLCFTTTSQADTEEAFN